MSKFGKKTHTHIWNIYEKKALESIICFPTSIMFHSLLTNQCEQCILFGGKISQLGEKKRLLPNLQRDFFEKDGPKSAYYKEKISKSISNSG